MSVYALEVLLIIGALGGGGYGFLRLLRSGVLFGYRRHQKGQPWKVMSDVVVRPDGNNVTVELYKPGEERILIKELDPRSLDFDMALYEAEAEAKNTALALNSR